MAASRSLRIIKWLHTLVWVFFVVCIGAIPFYALRGELGRAVLFIGIVFVEVLILMANRWSCPLTTVAARYTEERSANFDIYLPQWLARHNKTLFGGLYLLGTLLTLVKWLMG